MLPVEVEVAVPVAWSHVAHEWRCLVVDLIQPALVWSNLSSSMNTLGNDLVVSMVHGGVPVCTVVFIPAQSSAAPLWEAGPLLRGTWRKRRAFCCTRQPAGLLAAILCGVCWLPSVRCCTASAIVVSARGQAWRRATARSAAAALLGGSPPLLHLATACVCQRNINQPGHVCACSRVLYLLPFSFCPCLLRFEALALVVPLTSDKWRGWAPDCFPSCKHCFPFEVRRAPEGFWCRQTSETCAVAAQGRSYVQVGGCQRCTLKRRYNVVKVKTQAGTTTATTLPYSTVCVDRRAG